MTSLARPVTPHLLSRLLERPDVVDVVRALDAPSLHRLVDRVGLEDAGEVVALATTEQLERVLDEDLWKSPRPGEDEVFDADRFGLWLEILLETGEETAVEKVLAFDEDLFALGLTRLALVVDIEALAVRMSASREPLDQLDKALESCLSQEIDEYRLIARAPSRFDAMVLLLLALDRDHHDFVARVLERCCAVTADYVEDNGGLHEVLTSEEMLESDAAFEREQRREREGFVAPSDAASFLRLARRTAIEELVGIDRPRPRRRRSPGLVAVKRATAPALVERGMRHLAASRPRVYGERLEQLAYLVNVLVAVSGGRHGGLRPVDATEVATATCDLGLRTLLSSSGDGENTDDERAAGAIADHGLVKAFRVGWRLVGTDDGWSPAELREIATRARSPRRAPARRRARARSE